MTKEQFFNRYSCVVDSKTQCWTPQDRGLTQKEEGYWVVSLGKKDGYPRTKRLHLHRLVFSVFHFDPTGMIVMHACDNAYCINPDHLKIGTKQDNTQHMLDMGRESDWEDRRKDDGLLHRSKLTTAQHDAIKADPRSSYVLAEVYGVSSVQIRRIKNGSRCNKRVL